MGKILLLAIALWLLITVLRRYTRNIDPPPSAATAETAETMVQCAYCGLHLPQSDSLSVNHQFYCCETHSQQVKP